MNCTDAEVIALVARIVRRAMDAARWGDGFAEVSILGERDVRAFLEARGIKVEPGP